jgi:hypothetical protein
MGKLRKPIGTPRHIMHLEAETPDCICERISGCGGIEHASLSCPEHGGSNPLVRYHTHAAQVSRIAVGTALAMR